VSPLTARPTIRYRKPAQLGALGQRHAVVEASAGTGKTYILEHLVVDLILSRGASIEQILVVTFTEKATSELSARIRRKLEELRALREDHASAAGAPDEACWIIDDGARARLDQSLLGFDRAAISTIHGFCQRLLTEHAFLNRRLFHEEAVAEEEAFASAFSETLRREPAADPVLAELLGLWLAAAGGLAKLRRALAAAVRGLACLYPPRPEALRPGPLEPAAVVAAAATFAKLPGGDALKATLKRAGVNGNTIRALVDKWDKLQAEAARCQSPADVPHFLVAVEVFDKRNNDAIDYLEEKLDASADPEVRRLATAYHAFMAVTPPPLSALVARLAPVVSARLAASKRQAGLYDFQDMLTLCAESLDGDSPRARALLATLRARYRYALIDEFQDTDEVQWGIFRRIFFDSRDGHVLTVIGDPKQAIYAFRGADVYTYLEASRSIVAAGGAQVFLTENFRSTAPLIAAYNAVLDQSAPFFPPEGGIRYDHPVTCGRPELALLDAHGQSAPGVVVLDVETSAPSLLTWQVKRALLARIAHEARALLDPATSLRFGGPSAQPLRAGDIFVLTRTTRESREIGQALRAVGVPFAFFKQERLFETVEAQDLCDLLLAIADPDDVTKRARAFITPFFGLSLPDLAACDDLDPGDRLMRLLYEWRALADAGDFETLFARIIGESGVVCRELFFHANDGAGERALTNTLHLIEILQEHAARGRTTLRELCETLGAYIAGTRKPPGEGRDIQRLETDADAVQIMTIHHAKGLEAPVVFLYGGFWPGPGDDVRVRHEDNRRICDVGRAGPKAQKAYQAERDDEERRVLYVALTRAKGRLYLPRYPAAFKQLKGAYRFVNGRLDELLTGFTESGVRELFACEAVPCPGEGLPPPLPASPAQLAAWTPPPALLYPRHENEIDRVGMGAARAGFVTTSYSALKRTAGGYHTPRAAELAGAGEPSGVEELDLAPAGLVQAEGGLEARPAEPTRDELPGGRVTGRFLHALLEELPLASLTTAPALETWATLPEVEALFERVRRRYDLAPEHLPAARRLVHTALSTPVPLGAATVPALGTVARQLRELEFMYPIPEREHPLLDATAAGEGGEGGETRGFTIGRGLIKGYIDLLFEHDDRVYICDWKGDILPDFEAATLTQHVEANYDLQARLYTLGVLRFLGITTPAAFEQRFGGVVYAFLRGMTAERPGAGVYFARPAWSDVVAWQAELLGRQLWGVA
jgi:exodeoxyribonuclease V beta subunit